MEPEHNPEQIIERMERLIAEASSEREETMPLEERADPIAQKHTEVIRKGAEENGDE